MKKELNLIGEKYNMLIVIQHHHKTEKNMNYWLCRCDCGNNTIVSTHNLRTGAVKSCGCLNKINGEKRRKDLKGKTFFFLLVLERDSSQKNQSSKWKCLCSCGNYFIALQTELLSGKTKSCGCFRRGRLGFGENGFNRLYGSYKNKALKKEISFNLSKEEFKEITSKNCFYCGIEPRQKAPATNKRNYGYYLYNGIDRINSLKGYEKNNIVPCCGQCNVAKNNYSYDEFLQWVGRIYNNFYINQYEELKSLKI